MATFDLKHFGQHFLNSEFEVIYKSTSKEFQQLLGLNEFQNISHTFNQGVLRYEKFSEKAWFDTTQVIWIDQQKEKAILLAYDSNHTVLYLKPFLSYASDQDWTKNKYRLPICDDWFVFWGGTNEFDNYHYAYENQRYAYDLVRVKNGSTYEGTNLTNENYFASGKL